MAPSKGFGRSIHVDIDSEGRLQAKCHPMYAKELGKVIREIAELAREIVRKEHSKTHRLERSIQPYAGRSAASHIRRTGPTTISGTVTAGSTRAPYARYVHEGTLPHVIRPRKANGALSFVSDKRYGRTHFFRRERRLLTNQEIDDIYDTGNTEEWQRAYNRRMRRHRDWKAGRESFMRDTDFDVATETVKHKYAARKVVVPEVHHPGYRGHRFLNQAAAIVVGRRYGGQVNLGAGRFGRNNATWQRW